MLFKRIPLAVLGLAALGATGALGQTMTHGEDWSLSVNSTFFTDNTRSTLRSDDLIASGWNTLAEADQERVRTVCSALDLDIPMGGATTAAGDESSTSTEGTTDSGSTDTTTSGSTDTTTSGPTDNTSTDTTTGSTTSDATNGTTSSSDTSAGATSSTSSTDTTTTSDTNTDLLATPISDDNLSHLCRVLQQVKND